MSWIVQIVAVTGTLLALLSPSRRLGHKLRRKRDRRAADDRGSVAGGPGGHRSQRPDPVPRRNSLCQRFPAGDLGRCSRRRRHRDRCAARSDARFRAGSIIKPFVATVVLQLVEEGVLSLDDTMTKLLPDDVTSRFANSDRITLEMLLNHTSGIPEWLSEPVIERIVANPGKVWEVSEFLDLAAAQPPSFAPGEGWGYSNTDYNLLGLIIERATGQSWRDAVRKRVIERLGLRSTSLPEPGDVGHRGRLHARLRARRRQSRRSELRRSLDGRRGGWRVPGHHRHRPCGVHGRLARRARCSRTLRPSRRWPTSSTHRMSADRLATASACRSTVSRAVSS